MADELERLFHAGGECPPLEELLASAADRRTAPQNKIYDDHIPHCLRCSSELALLRQFEAAQPVREEREAVAAITARLRQQSPAKPEPWWVVWWRVIRQPQALTPVALALAALVIVVVIGVHKSTSPLEPSIGEKDLMRASRVVAISPIGDVPSTPEQLEWKPVPGATWYQVRLLEVDRTILWRTTTTSLNAKFPPQISAEITPRKTLMWDVTALDASGKSLLSSGLQNFRLVDSP